MNRRGFVATVLGAITAGLSRPWWERGAEPHALGTVGTPPTVNGLAFHKGAFAFAMEPLNEPFPFAPEYLNDGWAQTPAFRDLKPGDEIFLTSGGQGYIVMVPEDWPQ